MKSLAFAWNLRRKYPEMSSGILQRSNTAPHMDHSGRPGKQVGQKEQWSSADHG
jgi:hypothetical protein